MDNKLPNVNKDKPVWRCVDWSTNKANERFLKGKTEFPSLSGWNKTIKLTHFIYQIPTLYFKL